MSPRPMSAGWGNTPARPDPSLVGPLLMFDPNGPGSTREQALDPSHDTRREERERSSHNHRLFPLTARSLPGRGLWRFHLSTGCRSVQLPLRSDIWPNPLPRETLLHETKSCTRGVPTLRRDPPNFFVGRHLKVFRAALTFFRLGSRSGARG